MLQHHSKFEARIKFTTKNDGNRIVYALFTFLVQKSKQETGLKKQAPTSKTHLIFASFLGPQTFFIMLSCWKHYHILAPL